MPGRKRLFLIEASPIASLRCSLLQFPLLQINTLPLMFVFAGKHFAIVVFSSADKHIANNVVVFREPEVWLGWHMVHLSPRLPVWPWFFTIFILRSFRLRSPIVVVAPNHWPFPIYWNNVCFLQNLSDHQWRQQGLRLPEELLGRTVSAELKILMMKSNFVEPSKS